MGIGTATTVVVTNQTTILPAITVDFTCATVCFLFRRDDRSKDGEGREQDDGQREQKGQEPLRDLQVAHTERRGFLSVQDIVLLDQRVTNIGVLRQMILQSSTRVLETTTTTRD